MGGFGERKRERKIYNYIIILKNKEILRILAWGLERLRALCSSNEPEPGSQSPHEVALNPLKLPLQGIQCPWSPQAAAFTPTYPHTHII